MLSAYASTTLSGVTIAMTPTTAQRRSQRNVSETTKAASTDDWLLAATITAAFSNPNALSSARTGAVHEPPRTKGSHERKLEHARVSGGEEILGVDAECQVVNRAELLAAQVVPRLAA